MDGNGEARRSSTTVAAVGLSNRRCKTISARDPAEGGHAELLNTVRSRERLNQRDREKNFTSRSKRRRRGVSRVDLVEDDDVDDDDGEQSDGGESFGYDEYHEVADGSGVPRFLSISNTQSAASNQNDKNSLPLRVSQRSRKVADQMRIGVPVPRKTRSVSAMRSHENTISGTCGGRMVFEDKINLIQSNLTATPYLDLISASSSNVVIKENITRTPSPVHQNDIEFEIAEVLSGLMKQRRTSEKHQSPRNLSHNTEPEKISYIGVETRSSIAFPFRKASQNTGPTSVLHYDNNLASDQGHCDDVQKIKVDDDSVKTTSSIENELLTALQMKSEQSEAFCDTLALKDKLSSPISVMKNDDFQPWTMTKEISFVEERRGKVNFGSMTTSLRPSPPVGNGSTSSVSERKPIGLNAEMNANECEKNVELSITKKSELEEIHVKELEEKKAEIFNLYFKKQHIEDDSKLELQVPKSQSKDIAIKVKKNEKSCLSPLAIALDCSYSSLPKWKPPAQAGSLLSNMAQTPRKCATHYYIAQNIYSHKQYGKMNNLFEASNVSETSMLAATNLPEHSDDKIIELVNFMDRSEAKHLKHQGSRATPPDDLVHGSVFTTTTSQHHIVPSAGVHQPEDLKYADSLQSTHLSGKQVGGALPSFATQNETISFSHPNSALNQAPYLAKLPKKGTPLPISTPLGSLTAYKASTPPQAVQFLNGLWYPPPLAQLPHQPPQTIQHPWSVQATANNIYLLGSSDMQPHQSVRQHPLPSNQAFKVEETMKHNALSASYSKALNSQKSSVPVQMLNFSLGPSIMLGEEEDGNHGGNQPKQKFQTNGLIKGKVEPLVAIQASSFKGNGPPSSNLSFRAVSQKPILVRNIPDQALPPSPQAIQQKIHQPAEKGHLGFNHPGRTLYFTQRPSSEKWLPQTITSAGVLAKGSKGPQQQVVLPLQQHQMLQQSQSARTSRLSKTITPAVKSPNSVVSFQQPLIMCNSPLQSSQMKKAERSMGLLAPPQQGKTQRAQTQISFGGTHKPSLVAAANSK